MTNLSLHPNSNKDNNQYEDPNAQRLALAEALNARTVRICFLGRCVNAPPELARQHWPLTLESWRALLCAASRKGVRRG